MKRVFCRFFSLLAFLGVSCSRSEPKSGIDFVDDYLARWDRFAQGANELAPVLGRERAHFESELTALLKSDDKRAVSRLVFYPVIQVGGFIDVDSDLGREAARIFGPLPTIEGKNGKKEMFAGDMYFWWQDHRTAFPSFPLFEEWQTREFTRSVVIPMYQGARDQEKAGRTSESRQHR